MNNEQLNQAVERMVRYDRSMGIAVANVVTAEMLVMYMQRYHLEDKAPQDVEKSYRADMEAAYECFHKDFEQETRKHARLSRHLRGAN